MAMQTVTKTSATADTTTYTKVTLVAGTDGPSSETFIPSQALRVGAAMNLSGTCTIRLVLRDATSIYKVVDCAVTDSGQRQAAAGASGSFVGTVAATNADFADLAGYDPANGIEWYVGLSALTTATSVAIYLWPTRAI